MRYITILISIILFWFLLSVILTSMFQDPFITNPTQNTNFSIDVDSVNMTTDDPVETTTLRSFVNALGVMFAFRSPVLSGVPSIISTLLSFLNWFLVILLGISIYRIANPISGG